MEADELRALQAPLKQRYREDPGAALTPLSAVGDLSSPGVTAVVQTWAGPVRAGLHPATGGDGSDACSGDLLLQALAACAAVTLRSVATAMGLDVRGGIFEVEAAFDARGTLGVDRAVPVGITAPVVRVRLDCDTDEAKLAKLGELTERYCVVSQSLATPARVVVTRAGEGS